MNILAPSILSADFTILGKQIKETEEAGAGYLHFDVMDGIFVPSISFGLPVLKTIRKASNQIYDVHLMIEEPIRYIEQFAESGADIITFHVEAASDPREVIDKIHSCGKKAGMSIKPKTSVDALKPYLKDLDMVLIMTVEPGFGGQKYIEECTEKIRKTREMITDMGLNTDIEIDGGVTIDNINVPLEAGANVIVAGSAVFNGDITENTRKLLEKM
ncbi:MULTISPECIES: ribulose-phosphate 3-epimerase [unclassified Butyrivibrio]|uniref:ribulose-phosphate 3-epimerase n=1 Tax=unclassified Butyrivibrio TaxID=2639466 RepID=UPI00041A611F|nr:MULTISPECIES: ribulose-phosphate 3-epimerase [unclassified Butyrivibrio]